ncbi:MAG TPA: HAD-IA family hydrolase [Anaeromyxobacteraceae bacterium]|nr:HAD-IA family hydrolase [Anaeromyxobacteraceae bacterium]
MIRLAVFDLDGTLVDSRLDLCLAVNHALEKLHLAARSLEEVTGFIGEGARRLLERAVAPHLELTERAIALWREHYEVHLLDHTVLYPGLDELVRAAPYPLAVITNKPGQMARRILSGLGVAERFVEVVGADEAPRKPSPEGMRALLARQGVAAEEAVLVGDSLVDLATARAVPVRFLAVGWGLVAPEALVAGGAALVARTAAELCEALAIPPSRG